MKAIDTNLLVRFLVRDDPEQAQQVYRVFTAAEATGERLLLPLLVILETIWVLESVYSLQRGEIIEAIDDLTRLSILEIEGLPAVRALVIDARSDATDLSDLLIGYSAKLAGCDAVLTFDKKAARNPLFEKVA